MKNERRKQQVTHWAFVVRSKLPRTIAKLNLPRLKIRWASKAFAAESGLTLIELLVVLGILALVASIAGPQVLGYLGSAKTTTARSQINSLMSAVELYFIDISAYPSQEAGLKALVEAPPGTQGWNGPYLKKESGLLDPWGRPYGYRLPDQKGAIEIFSLGRDGQEGGTGEDADISSKK